MAAVAAACVLGVEPAAIKEAVRDFTGLEHRLEFVEAIHGISFFDDSYSTTAESTLMALRSFEPPLVLIAGGSDKGLDVTPIGRAAAQVADALITMGQTGPAIAAAARQAASGDGRSIVVQEVETLRAAVEAATRLAEPGATALFSPGCASYDMFENYRQRGEAFKAIVRTFRPG